jgi:hypothetical protein
MTNTVYEASAESHIAREVAEFPTYGEACKFAARESARRAIAHTVVRDVDGGVTSFVKGEPTVLFGGY